MTDFLRPLPPIALAALAERELHRDLERWSKTIVPDMIEAGMTNKEIVEFIKQSLESRLR